MVNKTLDYNKINHFNLTVLAKVCYKIKKNKRVGIKAVLQ